MDAKSGKPLGSGSSDTYDLQTLVMDNVRFSKPGIYKLKLTQYMRRDPLPHVLAVGVRIATASAQP
jgi:gliding motility-associated lipoprotein GldH